MSFAPYPLVRHFICFAAGIGGYLLLNYFNNILYVAFALALLATITFTFWFSKGFVRGIFILTLFFLSGWLLAYHSTPKNVLNHYIHTAGFGYYQATVISNPEVKPKTYKVEAKVRALQKSGKWQATTGNVLLYFPLSIPKKPAYGDVFLLKAMPRKVEAPKNPFEFDYRTYLARKGIYAHHFLREGDYLFIESTTPNHLLGIANEARLYGSRVFKYFLKDPKSYAIADAMVLGLRDELDHDLRGDYTAAGAVHILAVSGMHVGIVFLLLQIVFGQRNNTRNKRPNAWFAALVIACLFAYALLTGFSASVVRATVMFSFIQLAPLFKREQNIFNILALSAICLLCYNPYWLLDVGFQLSYLAVFGIVLVYPHLNQLISIANPVLRWLLQISIVSFSAQLFTFPLSCYYFHQFPNYFLLTNPLVTIGAVVIMPFGLLLLIFSGLPYIYIVPAFILKNAIYLLNEVIYFITELPNAVFRGISISVLEVVSLYLLIVLLFFFFLKKRLGYLISATILSFGLSCWNIAQDFQESKNKEITLHFIPKKSGISIIDGKNAIFISDKTLEADSRLYDFHLKNYYDSKGIINFQTHNPDSLQAVMNIEFGKIGVTWVHQKANKIITRPEPYVLISNNSIKDISKAFHKKLPQYLIIDDSNKKYIVESLIQQAKKLNIKTISLYEKGSFKIIQ